MATFRSNHIQSKTLFFTTSPRTPFKTIPEIALLAKEFGGWVWNKETQAEFYKMLADKDFFEGKESQDPAFSARDRINRIPKNLGLITYPVIGLSKVGEQLVESSNKEEILLRQLLKFQLPSPYHPLGKKAAKFRVKPYLEILRLIRDLDGLSFDELMIFGMQLVDYTKYRRIVDKIKEFRKKKEEQTGKYALLRVKTFLREAKLIYRDEIKAGDISTRESRTATTKSFVAKKLRNLRDYADAVVRHLRSTGIVNATAIERTLSIAPERRKDVDFILSTVERKPVFIDDIAGYQSYLFNPEIPRLLTDDKEKILEKLSGEFGVLPDNALSLNQLKDILNNQIAQRRTLRIAKTVSRLKDYELYDDIEAVFDSMSDSYDPSLFFEWNTWRAMTMLDGGDIHANLKYDDEGNPMNTALGNVPDIICDYGDFDVTVEVTTSKGALQYKMEGEPVPRHIGIHKAAVNKPTFCFFIAPVINSATIAHFYTLHHLNTQLYGGKCCIIPMTLNSFRKMLKASADSADKPTPSDIHRLFDKSSQYARECMLKELTETDWFTMLTDAVENWLSA